MRRDFAGVIRELWRPFADALDPYHPELHYMRGPGPKWHAKRAGIIMPAAPVVADAHPAPALCEITEVRA